MNEPERALEILRRARDLLTERLAERIVESRDEILEDATGLAFVSEIDAIYEQLGSRLAHVNSMISNLPGTAQPAPDDECSEPDTTSDGEAGKFASAAGRYVSLALPAPQPVAGLLASGSSPSFQVFANEIRSGDVVAAGRMLAMLFEVEPTRGVRCAQVFQERLRSNPEVLARAMQLRERLAAGSTNGSLMLLWQCFGLEGLELVDAMQSLKSRLP